MHLQNLDGQKNLPSGTKTSYDKCWLKEWLFKFIRAASGITFLGWSPQLSITCWWRARVFLIWTFPGLWFEGEKESIILHFYAQLPHTFPCQTAVSIWQWLALMTPRFSSLFQFPALDHYFKLIYLIMIFLVWKVRNTHHGTRKHICSDFRVVNFSLPSMRITSVLRLWKIKCIFHRELKCRNSHNFLLK